MQPSLNDADLRIKRARQHINSLRRYQRQIAINPDEVIIEPHPNPVEILPNGKRRFHSPKVTLPPEPPVNPQWAIRLGEAIFNLRAALDYLIYSLAYLDSTEPQNFTQFPICSTPEAFDQAANQNLKPNDPRCLLRGVSSPHIAAIKALQPNNNRGLDPHWLAQLKGLSNPDKHRHLTIVQSKPFEVRAWIISATPPSGMDMQYTATREIRFGDADQFPIIPILDSLSSHVVETLDIFRPDF